MTGKLNRRGLISLAPALPLAMASGCSTAQFFEEKGSIRVNEKSLAARRAEWSGGEIVFAVIPMAGAFVMVRHRSPLGWAFPGGMVIESKHGAKHPSHYDLVTAVTEYAHSQATLPLQVSQTTMAAYGYAIDKIADRMLMAYWFQIGVPASFPPTLTPNMSDVDGAKWVAPDDSKLSGCLQQRITEYQDAGEGGSIIIEGCVA